MRSTWLPTHAVPLMLLVWESANPQVPVGAAPKPLLGNAAPARSCASLQSLGFKDTVIRSARLEGSRGTQVCRVEATVTHPPATD
jgi:hypothetical protein